jgi:hypothetical protein
MDRFERREKIGHVLVIRNKRAWHTLPRGVIRVEGCEDIYFNDPDGRSAAACQTPITSKIQNHVECVNTPELRASGAPPKLMSVELPLALQSDLRDTISGLVDSRSLDNAVKKFVSAFVSEHPITKLFVATRLLWAENDGGYEIGVTELIKTALGRRLLVSHTLQLNRGIVQLTPLEVNVNFEKWATQVWTFDVPDNARQAVMHITPNAPLELVSLANEKTRNCPKFSAKQKQQWTSMDNQLKRKTYSTAIADELGINRLKVVRALDGMRTFQMAGTSKPQITPCIQQYIDGITHLDNRSRCTMSAVLARVLDVVDVEGILSALALTQSENSVRSLRLSMKHDTTHGNSFVPSCATCRDPKRQGFTCPVKSTELCAKQMGVKHIADNQTPADMVAGVKTISGNKEFKKRRLNSTVESPAEACEQAGNGYKGLSGGKVSAK